ncbi:MAG TPA: DUF2141 domain-containing protein [Polyangiaceae bacterium]|nr:DUF2141 domain-containing protein [Polyangiaceae bacterium]
MSNHPLSCCGRLAIAGLLASGIVQAEPASNSANSATISVSVGPLRNNQGSLACRLHSSGVGFPRGLTGTVSQRVKIAGSSARCVFENVPPGTYAVVVLHDENDNRECDRNRLGIPVEGYGVSNNHTYRLRAPTWQESKFVVDGGTERALAISLRY